MGLFLSWEGPFSLIIPIAIPWEISYNQINISI